MVEVRRIRSHTSAVREAASFTMGCTTRLRWRRGEDALRDTSGRSKRMQRIIMSRQQLATPPQVPTHDCVCGRTPRSPRRSSSASRLRLVATSLPRSTYLVYLATLVLMSAPNVCTQSESAVADVPVCLVAVRLIGCALSVSLPLIRLRALVLLGRSFAASSHYIDADTARAAQPAGSHG
jgi:hypothetical protein